MLAIIVTYHDRKHNRSIIEAHGGYYETHIDTDILECEKRDCKGLYKLARQGVIKEFTGISDPFEKPIKHYTNIQFKKRTRHLKKVLINLSTKIQSVQL